MHKFVVVGVRNSCAFKIVAVRFLYHTFSIHREVIRLGSDTAAAAQSIMDFIISVQGLRDVNNKFIPKEVAVLGLQNRVVEHWIIKAPHNFAELPLGIKRSNEYISNHFHGIRWHEGDISFEQLVFHLQQVAKVAIRVFTRGHDNWRYLENVMSREIVNVEDMYAPTFEVLKKNYPSSFMCLNHSIQDTSNSRDCALNQAYLLRKWLHSIAEDLTRDSPQKFSDALYCKLHARVRTVTNFFGDGGDEVDS